MNPLKIITKLLGWLGGAVGIKPGPDVERLPRYVFCFDCGTARLDNVPSCPKCNPQN